MDIVAVTLHLDNAACAAVGIAAAIDGANLYGAYDPLGDELRANLADLIGLIAEDQATLQSELSQAYREALTL